MTTRFDATAARHVAEVGGRKVGAMEAIDVLPFEVVMFHPVCAAEFSDAGKVAAALVDAGCGRAEGLGAATARLILEDRSARFDEWISAAPAWGFIHDVTKALVRAAAERIAVASRELRRGDVSFLPALDRVQLCEALAVVLATSITGSDRALDAAVFLEQLEARCRANRAFHPDDWQIAWLGDRIAGFVLPAFADERHEAATNLYVGVLPWARGRGLGVALARRGVETLRRRGATRYVGSCDVRNAPMLRAFARLGCERIATQAIFTRQLAPR